MVGRKKEVCFRNERKKRQKQRCLTDCMSHELVVYYCGLNDLTRLVFIIIGINVLLKFFFS